MAQGGQATTAAGSVTTRKVWEMAKTGSDTGPGIIDLVGIWATSFVEFLSAVIYCACFLIILFVH